MKDDSLAVDGVCGGGCSLWDSVWVVEVNQLSNPGAYW